MSKNQKTITKQEQGPPNDKQKIDVIKLILDNWGDLAKVLTLMGALLGGGYLVGYRVSTIEHSSKINSLINQKDKEIMDIREKYIEKRLEKIESADNKSKDIVSDAKERSTNEN